MNALDGDCEAMSSKKLVPVQVALAVEPTVTWVMFAVPVFPVVVAKAGSTGVVESSR